MPETVSKGALMIWFIWYIKVKWLSSRPIKSFQRKWPHIGHPLHISELSLVALWSLFYALQYKIWSNIALFKGGRSLRKQPHIGQPFHTTKLIPSFVCSLYQTGSVHCDILKTCQIEHFSKVKMIAKESKERSTVKKWPKLHFFATCFKKI